MMAHTVDRPAPGRWSRTPISYGSEYNDFFLERLYLFTTPSEWDQLRRIEVFLPSTEHYDLAHKIFERSMIDEWVDEETALGLFYVIHTISKHGWSGYVDARLGMLARAQFKRDVSFCVVAIAVLCSLCFAFVLSSFVGDTTQEL
jgi:hypothetical protein